MPPGARPDGPARHARARAGRRLLARLLLAVLTVVGGAPTAAGALYAAGPFAGAPPPAAQSPDARQPISHADRTVRTGSAHDSRRTRTATPADGHRLAPMTGTGFQPRAGAEYARVVQLLPPSGPESLVPGAPGLRPPRLLPRPVPAALSRTVDRFRVLLPGVRGPPRTAGHRPPATVPVRVLIPVRPPVPSH
ncbi:hypothetical protein [Streptomyces sp. NPDC052042]|uniref:hypothetical protein n=1 Tax=Streptomyces sp. NPDC052042 TaxID=3365683 RepID=UPI0037D104D9